MSRRRNIAAAPAPAPVVLPLSRAFIFPHFSVQPAEAVVEPEPPIPTVVVDAPGILPAIVPPAPAAPAPATSGSSSLSAAHHDFEWLLGLICTALLCNPFPQTRKSFITSSLSTRCSDERTFFGVIALMVYCRLEAGC